MLYTRIDPRRNNQRELAISYQGKIALAVVCLDDQKKVKEVFVPGEAQGLARITKEGLLQTRVEPIQPKHYEGISSTIKRAYREFARDWGVNCRNRDELPCEPRFWTKLAPPVQTS